MSAAEPSTAKEMSFAEKQAERMKRLRSLHSARNEARTHNHQEVVAEEARNKLPANYEAKRRQAEWLLDDQQKREEAEKEGKSYDRVKLLNISATEAERLERKKKKKNPDQGFSTYEQATVRQYNRLVKNMPAADMEQYERQRQKYGDAFYGGPNVIIHGMHADRKEAVDKMVNDLEGQIAKRTKYSRRRIHNDDADIDYINERNAKFNKKLERFYGEHTAEIKQNLERGLTSAFSCPECEKMLNRKKIIKKICVTHRLTFLLPCMWENCSTDFFLIKKICVPMCPECGKMFTRKDLFKNHVTPKA